jgi:hypothetical protein
VVQEVPADVKGRTDAEGEASLRGHLKAEGSEESGSQSYAPPEKKDDRAPKEALDLLCGPISDAAFRQTQRPQFPEAFHHEAQPQSWSPLVDHGIKTGRLDGVATARSTRYAARRSGEKGFEFFARIGYAAVPNGRIRCRSQLFYLGIGRERAGAIDDGVRKGRQGRVCCARPAVLECQASDRPRSEEPGERWLLVALFVLGKDRSVNPI